MQRVIDFILRTITGIVSFLSLALVQLVRPIKWFHKYSYQGRAHSEKLIIAATQASVVVATILILVKLYAWFSTSSMGVLAALVDSILDLFASVVNMIAVRYAMMPADEEHRYGHGKAEALAGLGQAAFISSSAIFLIIYTIERMVHPTGIESAGLGTTVILLSILLTLGLVLFQQYVVNQTGSIAVKADSLHYRADLLTNAGILLGLLLYIWGWEYADSVIALLIGMYILECAVKIGSESLQLLLDRALPEHEQAQIMTIASRPDEVLEVHDLRSRQSGQTKFVQMHVVLDGRLNLLEAHAICESIEDDLQSAIEGLDVIIHQDPHTEKQHTG